jgi:hypothetical protein
MFISFSDMPVTVHKSMFAATIGLPMSLSKWPRWAGIDDQGKAQRSSDVMMRFGNAASKCTRQVRTLWAPQRRNHSTENRRHHSCRAASFNERKVRAHPSESFDV